MSENGAHNLSTTEKIPDDLKTAFINAHECFDRLENIIADFFPVNRAKVTDLRDGLWDVKKQYLAELRDLIQN